MQFDNYNLVLVLLSYVISVLGSFTALKLARQLRSSADSDRFIWLTLSALSMGGVAIWSMHFIAMLAFDAGMPVSYDMPITLLSLVIAVVITGGALYLVGSSALSGPRLVTGGFLMGLGVAAMHYSGMAAMRMNMTLSYDTTILVISVVIAIVASTVALFLAYKLDKTWQVVGAALVMGIAVCGMHYTGMAAARFGEATTAVAVNPAAISAELLAYGVFLISLVALSASLVLVSSQVANQRLV